jgi:hypothetical protein
VKSPEEEEQAWLSMEARVMTRHIKQRPSNYASRYDIVEILMLTICVLFVVAVAFAF